jgi:hypothetical protein
MNKMERIDGENLLQLLKTTKDMVELQEIIKKDKVLFDMLQEVITKLYDTSIYVAEEIERKQKEWSANNGL